MIVSWKDWWASRTIRFNTYMAALWAALVPVLLALDESDLQALGLSQRGVVIVLAVLGALQNWQNNRLRKATTKPLEGRANA